MCNFRSTKYFVDTIYEKLNYKKKSETRWSKQSGIISFQNNQKPQKSNVQFFEFNSARVKKVKSIAWIEFRSRKFKKSRIDNDSMTQ